VSDAKCEDKSPKYSDSDGTDIRDTPAYWKGWDDAMKQKEQKHPNGCFTCDEYKKGYETGRLNGFTAGYNKAMKEVDQQEQKPEDRFEEAREKYQVEWSDEDERMLKSTIWHISNSLTNGKNTDCKCDLTEWLKEKLKSLRPVKREWSEEDEDFINMLILHFNYLIDKGGDSVETYKSYREKLKSLRPQPHWKPSEEQMEALERTIRLANFGSEENRRKALESLHDQLEKLM
jgi:hypothetical protein